MPLLRHVTVWPDAGFRDRPWCERPEDDAFARSARSVGEIYDEGLAAARLVHHVSSVQFLLSGRSAPAGQAVVHLMVSTVGEGEGARVDVPAGFHELPADRRAPVVLEVIHQTLLRLGHRHGWDLTVVRQLRATCVERGPDFVWAGPWKHSRDRQLQARPVFALGPDGCGRAVVEVQRTVDRRTVFVSSGYDADSTRAAFKRSAGTLRWNGPRAVSFAPGSGLPLEDDRVITLEIDHEGTAGVPPVLERSCAPDASAHIPSVVVVEDPVPGTVREIVVIGGGPTNGVPDEYLTSLHGALDRLDHPAVAEWWSRSPVNLLEIWYELDANRVGTSVRRSRNKVTAKILRPAGTIGTGAGAHRRALDDVNSLLAATAERLDLPVPPQTWLEWPAGE